MARAAYEHALDYAKERVQGGVPIIEHQSVKSRLFKMFPKVEAARSLARRVALYNADRTRRWSSTAIASKTFAPTRPSRWRATPCRSSAATG